MSLSIRDQSQVRGFSAWSELNYFVYRKLSSWDAFFKWYHDRAKWNIFTVLAPAANTTNIDYEQSLIFLLLAVYDKQWSVSCEYTRPFIIQPHQAPWWSQRTEHWPAWDANNESNVQVNSKTAHPPRTILGHLTRVKFRTVGNLTQNEARPVGHLTFVSKRLSAVGNKRISQFFDCRYHAGFSVVVVFISWNALNRARGVEKAKATRQRKKQEKKNDTMSV